MCPNFSRASVARTLMARLPRLFELVLESLGKSLGCRRGIILIDFLFYIENGILCVLIRIASLRTHNIPSCYRKSKRSLICLLTWRFHQPSLLELPLSRTNFHGPKGVRAIEVRLYICRYSRVHQGLHVL